MSLTKPILHEPDVFDVTRGSKFTFIVYGGDQVVKNTLIIRNNLTNLIIAQYTNSSYKLENSIPAKNTLSNGVQYSATIKTYNAAGDVSSESEPILFTGVATPKFNIDIPNNYTVKNASYKFTALYSGEDSLSEYNFKLYDALTGSLVQLGSTISTVGKDEYSWIFNGLENNTQYKIKAFGMTSGGLLIETPECLFDVSYIQSSTYANVKFENLSDKGCIKTSSSLTSLEGEIDGQPVFVFPSSIDLTNGQVVKWAKDFSLVGDFILRISCTGQIVPFQPIFEASNVDHSFSLQIMPAIRENKFNLEVTITSKGYTSFLLSNSIDSTLLKSGNFNILLETHDGKHNITIKKEG